MAQSLSFERMVLGHTITAVLFPTGNDWGVIITGGCLPHIGSISTAYWQPTGVELQEILLPTHRDNVVSRHFAGGPLPKAPHNRHCGLWDPL